MSPIQKRNHTFDPTSVNNPTTSPAKRLRGGGEYEEYYEEIEEEPPIIEEAQEQEYCEPTSSENNDKSHWSRPSLKPHHLTNDRDIHMQWLDIDMIGREKPLSKNPNPHKPVVGSTVGPVPVIRVFGVTDEGHSCSVFVHGFTPYGYFELPEEWNEYFDRGNSHSAVEELREMLNDRIRFGLKHNKVEECVLSVQIVDDRSSILGYDVSSLSKSKKFVKVYVAMPNFVPVLVRVLKDGISLRGMNAVDVQPYECNVPYVLRFMIDREATGAGWLTLPANTYATRTNADQETHCQLEVDICYPEIIPHKAEGEWSKIAPLRILSFDIECQGRPGKFPEAEQDPVIQIANSLTVYGEKSPRVKNVFTLKNCLPIVGAQVITSEEEEDVLLKWRAFLQACDADIITGYNVQNFDIPYLLDRADALSKKSKANATKMRPFKLWGRIKGQPAKMRESTFQSAAYGKRNNVDTTIDGRVVFDMLPYMQRNHKLSSYTLNSVSSEFLGQQKEDVHHSIISTLQNGSDEDRHRLAVYCLKDALLPQRLMDKLSVMVNYVEMARVSDVS